MHFQDVLPFTGGRPPKIKSEKEEAVLQDSRRLYKLVKIMSLALGFQGNSLLIGRTNIQAFEDSPYNFTEILQAIDTDSYIKQGFNKYKELMWKSGWDLIGDNQEAVAYIEQRFDLMEVFMRRPFDDFLVELGDQVVKFGNCFTAKARADIGNFLPRKPVLHNAAYPIAGYYNVGAENMQVLRDRHNRTLAYRQTLGVIGSGGTGAQITTMPIWPVDDMIHFYVDRKPGRAFGTPFIIAVLDDVIAFRQIEEDVQNLVHRELFPLYKYKVGTEEHPADPDEIDQAAQELAQLRTDGGLVMPERHDVEVIGGEGKALEVGEYLEHFRQRVIVGMGLSPHHLGILNEAGNRAVTDRLDIGLYDKVKGYQHYIQEHIRLHMINQLLFEGGFDPINSPEDRVSFRFNEIDIDTQQKQENHTIQKYSQDVLGRSETRMKLGEIPEAPESDTHSALAARMAPDTVTTVGGGSSGSSSKSSSGTKKATPPKQVIQTDTTPAAAQTPENTDKNKSSTGVSPNLPNTKRGPGNIARPANQFKRNPSPNIRHNDPVLNIDEAWLDEAVDLLGEE